MTQQEQQYSTPDGSVWVGKPDPNGGAFTVFNRIAGKGHENYFGLQHLDEVLKYWGPLSLYDPLAEQASVLTSVLDYLAWFGCKSLIMDNGGPRAIASALDQLGWEIVRKDRDV